MRAATRNTASWTSPRTPIPRTLPISRSRGRTVERTTSTTRLCFSSTTPVRTVKPNEKMPTRMRTAPMLANRNRARSASVCGSSSDGRGRLVGARRGAAWSTSLPARTASDAQADDARARRCSAGSGPRPPCRRPRPARTGRRARRRRPRPASASRAASAGGPIRVGRSARRRCRTRPTAACDRRPRGRRAPARRRPILGLLLAAEEERAARANEPTTISVVNSDAEDEPAAAAALEDLALARPARCCASGSSAPPPPRCSSAARPPP